MQTLVDRDGTLFDTCELNAKSYFSAGKQIGIDFDYELLFSAIHRGLTFVDFLGAANRMPNREEAQKIRILKDEYFLANLGKARLNEGLAQLISGTHFSIVSNGKIESTVALVGHFGIIISPKRIFGPHENLRPKPWPDIYKHALESLACSPHEAVAIEDSEVGEMSALNAGLKVLKVQHFCEPAAPGWGS